MAVITGLWKWKDISNEGAPSGFALDDNFTFTSNGQFYGGIHVYTSFLMGYEICYDYWDEQDNLRQRVVQWQTAEGDDNHSEGHFDEQYQYMDFGENTVEITDDMYEFIQRNATQVALKGTWEWNDFISTNSTLLQGFPLNFVSNGARCDNIVVYSNTVFYSIDGVLTLIQGYDNEQGGSFWVNDNYETIMIVGEQTVNEATYRFINEKAYCVNENIIVFPEGNKNYIISGQTLINCREVLDGYGITKNYPISQLSEMLTATHEAGFQECQAHGADLSNFINVRFDIVESDFEGITFQNITDKKIEVIYQCAFIDYFTDHITLNFSVEVEPKTSVTFSFSDIEQEVEMELDVPTAKGYIYVYPIGVKFV